MAATPIAESPAQFDRDLRSANQEWKRDKDADVKWSYGTKRDFLWYPPLSSDADMDPSFKRRPLGKPSDNLAPFTKPKGNINKYARTTGRIRECGNKHIRSKVSAREEIEEAASASRSVLDYLPASPQHQRPNPMDHVLYSFDRTDSPGRPLTLEIFVKTTGRETEKFVEKEYEVIDTNGDALRGRKARRNLRQGTAADAKLAGEEVEIDEDGFELV
ncbi:hypothetical protein M406DRAFT_350576 [Cryphonectria parasitica EP155]|uniref:Uncharacterized protein n=1 Tax=Cryphonectria parasitica (strain ATCC 38755 / EP155) TaxID=660469 RepID=A0A9P4Y5R4_CRYP1|nr:uncharacterized protein M406DRAFT_350576 [Cryphonectria parasitica EP155]KAF3767469.1 hypothetical protein M406DRAFT_350576 [Cryphonectria parasitica EP155]